MQYSEEAVKTVKLYEGFAKNIGNNRVQAYWDANGKVWTIGWGNTGKNIREGTVWTHAQAEQALRTHLNGNLASLKSLLNHTPPQRIIDAMVSFAYNVGNGNLAKSSLVRYVNNKQYDTAAKELFKWNKAGGSVMNGLINRRMAEYHLWQTGKARETKYSAGEVAKFVASAGVEFVGNAISNNPLTFIVLLSGLATGGYYLWEQGKRSSKK